MEEYLLGLERHRWTFPVFFDWGANGRRGNLDPPEDRVLIRAKDEYRTLTSLPDVAEAFAAVRLRSQALLAAIDTELGLADIYKRRGKLRPPESRELMLAPADRPCQRRR